MSTEPKVTQDTRLVSPLELPEAGDDYLRLSKSGYSLRVGWGDDKRIIALSPQPLHLLSSEKQRQWLEDADRLCDGWNQRSRGQANEAAVIGTYCSVMKGDKATCDLHNLHCAYPSCCESVAPPVATEPNRSEGEAGCKGENCGTTSNNHSPECEAEHEAAYSYDAGNRHPEFRYAGYKGRPIPKPHTTDQFAAYCDGVKAQFKPEDSSVPPLPQQRLDAGRKEFEMYAHQLGVRDFESDMDGYKNPNVQGYFNYWTASREALIQQSQKEGVN